MDTYPRAHLTQKELKLLLEAHKQGDRQAMVAIIAAYKDLIYKIAHRYAYARRHPDVEDFVQEGMIALLKAVESYNPKKGAFAPFLQTLVERAVCATAGVTPHAPFTVAPEDQRVLRCIRLAAQSTTDTDAIERACREHLPSHLHSRISFCLHVLPQMLRARQLDQPLPEGPDGFGGRLLGEFIPDNRPNPLIEGEFRLDVERWLAGLLTLADLASAAMFYVFSKTNPDRVELVSQYLGLMLDKPRLSRADLKLAVDPQNPSDSDDQEVDKKKGRSRQAVGDFLMRYEARLQRHGITMADMASIRVIYERVRSFADGGLSLSLGETYESPKNKQGGVAGDFSWFLPGKKNTPPSYVTITQRGKRIYSTFDHKRFEEFQRTIMELARREGVVEESFEPLSFC